MNIRTKIIIAFLTISISGIGLLGAIAYQFSKAKLIELRKNELASLALRQKTDLQYMYRNWEEKIALISGQTTMRQLFLRQAENPQAKNEQEIEKIFRDSMTAVPEIEAITLCLPSGQKVISAGRDEFVVECVAKEPPEEMVIDNVWTDPEDGQLYMLLENAIPPIMLADPALGIIKTVVNANEVQVIKNNFAGLGETGETILGFKDKNGETQLLSPTRHATSNLGIESDQSSIARAWDQEPEFMVGEQISDYRGAPVLAFITYIPELGWGLAAKMDMKEVLKPANVLLQSIFLYALVISAFVGAAGLYFSRVITRPIMDLTKVAKKIRAGEFTERVAVTSHDEMGYLAETFNSMLATLTQKTDELAESNEELEQFAYIASHDLKAPLRAIKNISNWIEEDLGDKLEGESKESFRTLRSRIERMETMLESLLAYSRVGQEDRETNETLSGDALLQDVLSLIPVSESVTIHYSPAFASIMVKRMPLQQIFLNLISNAIKYNDKEQGIINVDYEEEGDFHVFSVKDNGPGIAEENREKIFEMFHKLESRDDVEGSGIGLAIVQKAIKLHGGKISLTSEPGEGSTFTFSWPKLDEKQES